MNSTSESGPSNYKALPKSHALPDVRHQTLRKTDPEWLKETIKNGIEHFPFKLKEHKKKPRITASIGKLNRYDQETRINYNGSWLSNKLRAQNANGHPTYVVSIIMVSSNDLEKDSKHATKVIESIRDQGFGKDHYNSRPQAKQRVALLFGLNRFKSIDQKENEKFYEQFSQFPQINGETIRVPGISYRFIAVLWRPNWSRTGTTTRSKEECYEMVRQASPKRAQELREYERGRIKHLVPYQSLRDWNMHYGQTYDLIRPLSSNTVYWTTMDSDFLALKKEGSQGLFSLCDKIIKKNRPTLLSTGYFAIDKPFYQIAIRIEMMVREGLSKAYGLFPYYPEPIFMIQMPKTRELFNKLTYWTSNEKKDDEAPSEAKHFVRSANELGIISADSSLFVAKEGLYTTLPPRFRRSTTEKHTITSRDELFSIPILKSIRGVRQSHIFKSEWAKRIWGALPNPKGKHVTFCKHVTPIFRPFDPVDFTEAVFGSVTSLQLELITSRHTAWCVATCSLLLNQAKEPADTVKELLSCYEGLTELKKANSTAMKALLTNARKRRDSIGQEFGISEEWVERIVEAAYQTGVAFAIGLLKVASEFPNKAHSSIDSLTSSIGKISLQERPYPKDEVVRTLGFVARAYQGVEEQKKGTKYRLRAWKKSLEIYKDQKDLDVAFTQKQLGRALLDQDSSKKALEHLKASLEIYLAIYPDTPSEEVATGWLLVGSAQMKLDRFNDAAYSCKRAALIYQKLYPKPCSKRAFGLKVLGLACAGADQHEKALRYLGNALKIYRKVHKQPHEELAMCLTSFALISRFNGNLKEAIGSLQEALSLYTKIHKGKPHTDIAECLKRLGKCAIKNGQKKEGMGHLTESYNVYSKCVGPDHSDTIEVKKLIEMN